MKKINEKVDKIRKRTTYKFYKEIAEFLNKNPSNKEILLKIHNIVDRYSGYKSARNSRYAIESIIQLINDKEVK